MQNYIKKISIIVVAIGILGAVVLWKTNRKEESPQKAIPRVAIVDLGYIPPLEAALGGLKKELSDQGYIEGQTIQYDTTNISFDFTLIPQAVTNLKNRNPKVMVCAGTSIAQWAKAKIHDIPIVYNVVTDPVEVGLLKDPTKPNLNMTGSSDQQDLGAFLECVKSILPHAKAIGLLHLTSSNNDDALVHMMRKAAAEANMSVLAIPVDQARDVPIRVLEFKGKVDLIYIGASGIQETLPTIAAEALKMNIPVFNMEEQAVRDGLVLASCGVNYESIGRNCGKIIALLLKGVDVGSIKPIYPSREDYRCYINRKLAERFGAKIPQNAIVVE